MAITKTQQSREGLSSSSGELLVCGCQPEDLGVLEEACASRGPSIRIVGEPAELARLVVSRMPRAVFLGLRKRDRARLKIIPVLRAAWNDLPVVVVADEASLELERRARQQGIFYYFLHPLVVSEVQAVLSDLMRRSARHIQTMGSQRDVGKKRSES